MAVAWRRPLLQWHLLRTLSSLSTLLSPSGSDSAFLFRLLTVGLGTHSPADESEGFWMFVSALQLFSNPICSHSAPPCPFCMLGMDKAESYFFMPSILSTVCSILVFSLSHPLRVSAEMKYVGNKWESPYSGWITALRNIVICNSLNALFAIYIYWKLILPCISSFSMTDHW